MVHNGPPHPSNFGYSYAKRMIGEVRETRERWPLMTVESEVNREDSKRTNERGPFLVGLCPYKRFLFCLGCSSQPSTKYIFPSPYTIAIPFEKSSLVEKMENLPGESNKVRINANVCKLNGKSARNIARKSGKHKRSENPLNRIQKGSVVFIRSQREVTSYSAIPYRA